MRELGAASQQEHEAIVALLQELEFKNVWLVGREFAEVAKATDFRCFADVEEVKETLRQHPLSEKLILVKGSNGTKLFQLPEFL